MTLENSADQQICPWCQMEIIWDPDIGPENECPHCLNELGAYRTVTLDVDAAGGEAGEDADVKDKDTYNERVAECLDTQIEAPECFRCQALMLFAGTHKLDAAHFDFNAPQALGHPFLPDPCELHLYVCPTCFNTDTKLSPENQMAMFHLIRNS